MLKTIIKRINQQKVDNPNQNIIVTFSEKGKIHQGIFTEFTTDLQKIWLYGYKVISLNSVITTHVNGEPNRKTATELNK